MKHILIEETMADMDKNSDGYVTVDEYISDIWPQDEQDLAGGQEPNWVKSEREQFRTYRDMDGVRFTMDLKFDTTNVKVHVHC